MQQNRQEPGPSVNLLLARGNSQASWIKYKVHILVF